MWSAIAVSIATPYIAVAPTSSRRASACAFGLRGGGAKAPRKIAPSSSTATETLITANTVTIVMRLDDDRSGVEIKPGAEASTARVRSDRQPVSHRVLADRTGLHERQQIVGPAGLGPGPRQPVATERLASDDRAGDPAVDVQVADRRAPADVANGSRIPREQATGQRDRKLVDRSQACSTSRTRCTASSGPNSSSRRSGDVSGRSATTVGAAKYPRTPAPAPWR